MIDWGKRIWTGVAVGWLLAVVGVTNALAVAAGWPFDGSFAGVMSYVACIIDSVGVFAFSVAAGTILLYYHTDAFKQP